jgi:hypothetical protein
MGMLLDSKNLIPFLPYFSLSDSGVVVVVVVVAAEEAFIKFNLGRDKERKEAIENKQYKVVF